MDVWPSFRHGFHGDPRVWRLLAVKGLVYWWHVFLSIGMGTEEDERETA